MFTAATLGRLRKQDSVYDAAEVVEIIIHPNWSRATARHDIAVLRLADPMPGYQPARLPFGVGQVPKKDDDVTVLGFGLEDGDADGLSDDLRQVTIEVQKKDDCDPFGFPFSINKKFCAGGEGKVSLLDSSTCYETAHDADYHHLTPLRNKTTDSLPRGFRWTSHCQWR